MRKALSVIFILCVVLSCLSSPAFAVDYDEEAIYNECYILYPDFVNNVKAQGVNDRQIVSFLSSVEKYIVSSDTPLTLENFDSLMFDALGYSFGLRPHIRVRDALTAAYPDAVVQASSGVITDDFMPIYLTVKRILFGIDDPVITLSTSQKEGDTLFFAHSVNLPDDCRLILALYNDDDALIAAQSFSPGTSYDAVVFPSFSGSARLFALNPQTLAPVCDCFSLSVASAK